MDRRRRRKFSRRDGNHSAICSALRSAGRSVLELDDVGSGTPDILVGWGLSRMVLMEIKDATGHRKKCTLQDNQRAWHADWKGTPVIVVRSVPEALAATGVKMQGGAGACGTARICNNLPDGDDEGAEGSTG